MYNEKIRENLVNLNKYIQGEKLSIQYTEYKRILLLMQNILTIICCMTFIPHIIGYIVLSLSPIYLAIVSLAYKKYVLASSKMSSIVNQLKLYKPNDTIKVEDAKSILSTTMKYFAYHYSICFITATTIVVPVLTFLYFMV
jgi:hypothetical protein